MEDKNLSEQIKLNANELARLTLQQQIIKTKIDTLKGFFEKLAADELTDTKLKTVEYWGTEQNCITVSNSETVKIVSVYMLKQLFGELFGDFVKEEISYKLTEPCKRFLGMVCQGNYTDGSTDNIIGSITTDPKMQTTLSKKLKGKYDKDVSTLVSLVGITEAEASDWAYLINEVKNYENLCQILKASNSNCSVEDAIAIIESAVIVEKGIKVKVAAED